MKLLTYIFDNRTPRRVKFNFLDLCKVVFPGEWVVDEDECRIVGEIQDYSATEFAHKIFQVSESVQQPETFESKRRELVTNLTTVLSEYFDSEFKKVEENFSTYKFKTFLGLQGEGMWTFEELAHSWLDTPIKAEGMKIVIDAAFSALKDAREKYRDKEYCRMQEEAELVAIQKLVDTYC